MFTAVGIVFLIVMPSQKKILLLDESVELFVFLLCDITGIGFLASRDFPVNVG